MITISKPIVDPRITDNFGLTTAHIFYHLPDHHDILQEFVMQKYDLFPHFPELCKFLEFWVEKIEGPIHSVTVAHARLITPKDFDFSRTLH